MTSPGTHELPQVEEVDEHVVKVWLPSTKAASALKPSATSPGQRELGPLTHQATDLGEPSRHDEVPPGVVEVVLIGVDDHVVLALGALGDESLGDYEAELP
jgi:hypothetical protein